MRKTISAFALASLLLTAATVPLFGGGPAAHAVPAHVHTSHHCQDLANGQFNHGVHVAHDASDVVTPLLCGHP